MMKFRPCIDIHNGKVKQIVGSSLRDQNDWAAENYVAEQDAFFFAKLYKELGLTGGHIIMLNPASSPYYEETKRQAVKALNTYPGGMQIGGGINAENAEEFLQAGASHVIVTSYVFRGGQIRWEQMERLKSTVGKERVVIDVSCRKREDDYYIVTDRWQNYTDVRLTEDVLRKLEVYCDEFLVHGVDVEGKSSGIDEKLARLLGNYNGIPVTYAGGIGSFEDLKYFEQVTQGKVDFTIGSALDLFGGTVPYDEVKLYRL